MVRELSSVANQLGLKRTLCEVYGAGGWDLRFEDMKRIGDWLQVLGVNTLNEHLSYVTIRGARKRDHPQSFSYHEPWWDAYHVSASYLTRVSVALAHGEQINRVLVLEPTTTAWMYQGDGARLNPLGDSFFKLVMALDAAQVEYDLGCEDVLTRHASVAGKELKVGQRSYKVVVVPAFTENVNSKTAKLLEDFLQAGGAVVACGEAPARVDGSISARVREVATNKNWRNVNVDEVPEVLHKWSDPELFSVTRTRDDHGILFHHRRQLEDGEVLFLVNTSIESSSSGVFQSNARGIEKWDLSSGEVARYPFETRDKGVKARFTLPPSGSLLLFLSKKPLTPAPTVTEANLTVAATGPLEIRRLEPNVLTLDYVDITAGGETRTNVYFYQANQFAWQKNGMERNPWDSAVQFKDELISKRFPPESGFTARYKFIVEGAVPKSLAIVIERPDLYSITCNGTPIRAKKGAWWLDKAFGRISIASAAQTGENVVTIQAAPLTMYHELEPAYVLGDFSLLPTQSGFVIRPDQRLELGRWDELAHPFYAHGVGYTRRFHIEERRGQFQVALGAWRGSVAKVLVNGKGAGYISAPPWECDVTKQLKPGNNTIEVVVIGTLKNTLGPHHGNPPVGSAWPGMFQHGPKDGPPPGNQYATVGYGLFEPFALKLISGKLETRPPIDGLKARLPRE
jgi:hypothetical protein